MNVIKGKYESSMLKAFIKEGEDKVETELLESIRKKTKTKDAVLRTICLLSMALTVIFGMWYGNKDSTPMWLGGLSILTFIVFLIFLVRYCFYADEDEMIEKYEKRGHILENPYDEDFQELTRLTEIGEQICNIIKEDESSFVIAIGQHAAICSAKDKKVVKVFDLDKYYGLDVIKDDCLDFSELDEYIEEYIEAESTL